MQNEILDFSEDYNHSGYRLGRLEVYNWGTFKDAVWNISPLGSNSLLTGDIGSGKSTLVDAITSLLVPHHRVIFNKASGAESGERTLYRYIRGAFKEEKDEYSQGGKVIYLRGERTYSILLAEFYNKALSSYMTLAQFFWLSDEQQKKPQRFFVIAEKPMTIKEYFSDAGGSISALRKKLSKKEGLFLCDTFKEYSNRFRKIAGIESEKALELFYQTISLKSVDNLNQFIRTHMLERGQIDDKIAELKNGFDNLNRAHQAVLLARDQIKYLSPIIEDGKNVLSLTEANETLKSSRNFQDAYFAEKQSKLLNLRIEELRNKELAAKSLSNELKDKLLNLRSQKDDLMHAIEKNGGGRLRQIETEIFRLEKEKERREAQHKRYKEIISTLKLAEVSNHQQFAERLGSAKFFLNQIEEKLQIQDKEKIDLSVVFKEKRQELSALTEEISSLEKRSSNIPAHNLKLRESMAAALNITEDRLPFAGELLQIHETEKEWEGAIERVLHNFSLSILVSDDLYNDVSQYVNRTQLKGRLVYLKVRKDEHRISNKEPLHNSLIRKIRIHPETLFFTFLDSELRSRFDFACSEDLTEFRRLPFAITREGQIKSGNVRHEKDDRRSIQDRSQYVLGWSNEEKKRLLKQKRSSLENEIAKIGVTISRLQEKLRGIGIERDAARDLLQFQKFDEINWQQLIVQTQDLNQESAQIKGSSSILNILREKQQKLDNEITAEENKQRETDQEIGGLQTNIQRETSVLDYAKGLYEKVSSEEREKFYPVISELFVSYLNIQELTLLNFANIKKEFSDKLQKEVDEKLLKIKKLSEKVVLAMKDFAAMFPVQSAELEVRIEGLKDYEELFLRLKKEDLPRHEKKFKEILNKNTINGIALFQNQLMKSKEEIEEKINIINQSLHEIEYNTGSYIQLSSEQVQDTEIKDFQNDLRRCLSQGLSENEFYNETKFNEVKAIIDRFNGRTGLEEPDRRWTEKVTDVRNWIEFSACEKWREDDSEKEFYSGSSGKSGGQKEKLAYTILASALSYQFGLNKTRRRAQSFRFVLIDEAFGRGSEESTRYALELFAKLNLQLLVVTPLQKINIIEDYINTIHFVHNEDGSSSKVQDIKIQEYRSEKKHLFVRNKTQNSVATLKNNGQELEAQE